MKRPGSRKKQTTAESIPKPSPKLPERRDYTNVEEEKMKRKLRGGSFFHDLLLSGPSPTSLARNVIILSQLILKTRQKKNTYLPFYFLNSPANATPYVCL
jgi:hypothetical protein